jgi:hypothetical protein
MNIIPYNKLKSGSHNVNLSYDGASPINKAYYGEALTLVRFSEYPRLELSVDELSFAASGSSPEIVGITTNANWSASTSANWVTLSISGDELTISVADYESEVEDRTATVTVTAWNADASISETISITQKKVTHVVYLAYVYRNAASLTDHANYSITTPIYPADDCEMRIQYQARGVSCDRIVGVSWADRGDQSDSKDFRLFNFNSGSLDVNSGRWSYLSVLPNNGYVYDFTVGNAFLYDNINETYKTNNSPQTPLLANDTLIHVDIGVIKVARLTISNGGSVVFDGKAAYHPDTGKYGLWDEVSGQLYTNDNITMTGDELS